MSSRGARCGGGDGLPDPAALSSEARLALYRTAQEALTSVRRHADAEAVVDDSGRAARGLAAQRSGSWWRTTSASSARDW